MTERRIEYRVIPPEADGEFVANRDRVLSATSGRYKATLLRGPPT